MRKIAILSSASGGGAGIAARRLWSGLTQQQGVDADFIDVASIGEALPAVAACPGSASNRIRTDTHFTAEFSGFVRGWMVSLLCSYDFINVHWASFLVSTSELIEVARRGRPVLISMHDFHYTTGGCHYPAGCTGQLNSCMACPQVDTARFSYDAVMSAFADKKHLLSFDNVHISAPSEYLVGSAVKAGLAPPERAHVIRNIFEPALPPRNLGESKRSRHILLIAASLTERRKAMPLAIAALAEAAKREPGLIVHLVGQADRQLEETCKNADLSVINHGKVSDDRRLAEIYQSVGMILTCSLEDNWPNVLVEAGVYGVIPIVGAGHGCEEFCRTFDVGVVIDTYTPASFAAGLLRCLEHFPSDAKLRQYAEAVRKVSRTDVVVDTYLSVLEKIKCMSKSGSTTQQPVPLNTISSNYLEALQRLGKCNRCINVTNGPFSTRSHQYTHYGLSVYKKVEGDSHLTESNVGTSE